MDKNYWINAAGEFHKLKSLVFAALIIALAAVMNTFYIPVAENLHISFTFIVMVFGSIIFGPIVGLAAGVVYDLLGFIITPSFVFFPGYTLSSMLEFFIYGLFLYDSQITVFRIFIAKFLVDFGIHVGLGSLWSCMLYGKGYYYFLAKSLIKNTVMLPVEVIMLTALLQVLLPVLVHENIVPKQKRKYIPLF